MNDTLRHAALYGAIGFMYHSNSIFKGYNVEFAQLVIEYCSMFYSFYDCMINVGRECEQSYIQLEYIKSKLYVSNRNRRFCQMDMMEIAIICEKLKNNFDALAKLNIQVVRRGYLFNEKIVDLLERFQKSRYVYTIKYTIFGMTEGGFLFNTILNNFPLSAFCGFLGVRLAMFCTSYEKRSLEIILNQLKVRTMDTSQKWADFRDMIEVTIQDLENYHDSANQNVMHSLATGVRVVRQTTKMIDETTVIQIKLQEIANEGRIKTNEIKRIIVSESANGILSLSGIFGSTTIFQNI